MDDLKKIKAKIAALLAKAQSTDNENEAAVFMEKVESMLEAYQLELWQITSHDDPMGFDVAYEGTSSSPTWQRHLIGALAVYYGCKAVRRTRIWKVKKTGGGSYDNFELDIIGRESSRVTVMLMYPFVMEQVRQAGRRLFAQGHHGTVDQLTRRVANALVARIYEMETRRRRDEQGPALTDHESMRRDRALVVVNEIRAFVDERYGSLSKAKSKARSTTEAAQRAAQGISIERQVRGAGQLKIGHG